MPDTLAFDAVPFSPAGFRQLGVEPAPSPATLHRWRLRGLRGIRVVTFLRGGRRYITPEAAADFFAAVTAAADGQPLDLHQQHKGAALRAAKELETMEGELRLRPYVCLGRLPGTETQPHCCGSQYSRMNDQEHADDGVWIRRGQ